MRTYFLALTILVILVPIPASAYIDPNTGGYIFQVFVPLLSAAALALVFLRKKLKSFFLFLKRLLFKK